MTLLYVALLALYILNPLDKVLPDRRLLLFPFTVIGLVSFWRINLFFTLWIVVSAGCIAYYFVL
ncbi:hypothetical protein [Spirosoma oryzae]|nr:hypothetical protein [Spirosoma oryzae]